MKKTKCPNCNSYDVIHIGTAILAIGFACGVVGLFIWPLLILAAPSIVLGILVLTIGRGRFDRMTRYCRNCKHQW